MNNIKNIRLFIYTAFFVFLFDQITKIYALYNFTETDIVPLFSRFGFQLIFNESTVLLNTDIQTFDINHLSFRFLFVAICIVLSIGILWTVTQKGLNTHNDLNENNIKLSLFILLGAIWGNGFDRLFRHYGVIDFIRYDYSIDSIPIFNIADLFILLSTVMIMYSIIITTINYKKYAKI